MTEREFLKKAYFENVVFVNFDEHSAQLDPNPLEASSCLEGESDEECKDDVVVDFALYSWLQDRHIS